MLLSCGEKQIDLLITFSAGPGFISMSPDSTSFLSDAEYCLLLKFFQQFLYACDDRSKISCVKRMQVLLYKVNVP